MTHINSVLGPISPDDLGFTLMHEHVMVSASGLYDSYPDLLGADREAKAIACLTAAKAAGIDTMVDATTFDLGRNPELLRTVAAASRVNIINVTGWWLDVPRFLRGVSVNQMRREFVRDIAEGFRGTDIKAGILKCAADFAGVTAPLETMAVRWPGRMSTPVYQSWCTRIRRVRLPDGRLSSLWKKASI